MLKEAKKALRVTVTNFDDEIMRLCQAGLMDLQIAGVAASGTVAFTESTSGAVTDTSTLNDPLVQRAIITYVRANFGSPADADRLVDCYEAQKGRLMHATGYTDYGEDDADAEE
jgi:hypothetical protein